MQHKNKCHITVANTGEPIPDELKTKIFERFFRSDESRNREENRYGLGLAIAQSFTELQNGKFHVEIDGDLFKVTIIFNKNLNNE